MRIEWDRAKAEANMHAHGVRFSDAATVLNDERALTREDLSAIDEQRFITLGMSAVGDLLVVVFTHRGRETYRLISAWKASKRQRIEYEKGHG